MAPKTMKKTNQNQNQNRTDEMDNKFDFKQIMKDIQFFDASHRTWKEKKELENRKVISLGGKPPKKQRLPLNIARVQMKKQKIREEKLLEENMVLGRFGGKLGDRGKRSADKRRPEDRALRSSEGYFRNGVLDVNHLLKAGPSRSGPSRSDDFSSHMFGMGEEKKKGGNGKKNQGKRKKKGGGKKRH